MAKTAVHHSGGAAESPVCGSHSISVGVLRWDHRLRVHGFAQGDQRSNALGAKPVPAGSVHQHAVLALREVERPDQGTVLGRKLHRAAVQAVGKRKYPVAVRPRLFLPSSFLI